MRASGERANAWRQDGREEGTGKGLITSPLRVEGRGPFALRPRWLLRDGGIADRGKARQMTRRRKIVGDSQLCSLLPPGLRMLLAIGSGPGRGLPLRSCGAADALRIARWWRGKQAVEGGN
jgi:hypothetical protein